MSVSEQITRLQGAKTKLHEKAQSLGIIASGENYKLDELADIYDDIPLIEDVGGDVDIDNSITVEPGYHTGATYTIKDLDGDYKLQDYGSVTPTTSTQTITPGKDPLTNKNYYGIRSLTVNPIPAKYQDVTPVTAAASEVLATKVFVAKDGTTTTGTMANRGAVNITLDTATTSYTVPTGYHNGSGKVSISTETKSATPAESSQTISASTGKVLSSVTVAAIPSKYKDATDKTAVAANILSGKTAVSWDATNSVPVEVTGTMTDNGAVSKTLSVSSTSYTVPAGYHNGSGKVQITTETKTVTPTEESQTINPASGKVLSQVTVNAIPTKYADATGKDALAANLLSGKTAISWDTATSKPVAITGTMANNGAVTPSALVAGGSYTIPAGYHNGSGKVTAQSLASQTGVSTGKTAIAAAQVLTGYEGWVNGARVTGTMANNGSTSKTFDPLTQTSVSIPAGYTTGGTITLTSDLETALAAI